MYPRAYYFGVIDDMGLQIHGSPAQSVRNGALWCLDCFSLVRGCEKYCETLFPGPSPPPPPSWFPQPSPGRLRQKRLPTSSHADHVQQKITNITTMKKRRKIEQNLEIHKDNLAKPMKTESSYIYSVLGSIAWFVLFFLVTVQAWCIPFQSKHWHAGRLVMFWEIGAGFGRSIERCFGRALGGCLDMLGLLWEFLLRGAWNVSRGTQLIQHLANILLDKTTCTTYRSPGFACTGMFKKPKSA